MSLSGSGGGPALDAALGQRSGCPAAEGAAEVLLKPPVNVLRLSLHPDGLARRIANLAEWRKHLLE
ncbi:MAG: transcriptional regulator [Rhodospirillales bacterium]|nr:transcriptional regulator [Rhodospirillales bacterium]